MLPVGAPRVLAERLDLAADACGARDAFVSRHQLDLERLRKRHVGGVVRGEVVSQLPAARKQGLVWSPPQQYLVEIGKGKSRAALVRQRTPPHRDYLEVDDLRSSQVLAADSRTRPRTIVAVVAECGRQNTRVDDDHCRWSLITRRRGRREPVAQPRVAA